MHVKCMQSIGSSLLSYCLSELFTTIQPDFNYCLGELFTAIHHVWRICVQVHILDLKYYFKSESSYNK
jgi:hypothetical protein